ncbi:MAG: serine hydrolase [Bacteroidales bacterium]|nr:serine hydrolase [Bacteroidales bacterium]
MNTLNRTLCCLAALGCISLSAQTLPYYDDGLPRSTPEAEGIPSETIAEFFKALDEGGYEVHGLMILRHDKVVAEHWWAPYGPQYPHAMYSATKSFTGAAVGFAVQEGLLKVSDKVQSFFPELMPEHPAPELARLTVEHLLTMSAGHARTSYPGSGTDQVRSFLAMDYAHEPGTSFAYNITCSHMLSNIITKVTGLTLYEYLKPRLLDPLGIKDVVWEMDMDGRNMGNGGMHSKTSDLAKFGIFLKNKGMWNGKQLLNREWVEAMTTPHIFQRPGVSEEENNKDDGGQGYGYQVWMGRRNSYRAIGGQNQLIMVIPEYDLVVASNGSIGDEAGFNSLIYNMLDSMSDKKLKPNKSFDLDAAIKDYALKRPFPATRMQPSVVSRTLRYKMHQNTYGITGIAFRFDAAGDMYLTLETGSAIHNIPFGLDCWKMGATDRTLMFGGTVYANTMGVTPMTTAGYCSWTAPDELSAYYLSLFNNGCQENFRFAFSEGFDELTVTIVGPQPRTRPGAAPAAPAASRDIVMTASRIKSTY